MEDDNTFLSRQIEIISTLTINPTAFVKIMFDEFISVNDPLSCCIKNNTCPNINITPLGKQGKVGIPYILTTHDRTYIVKLSELSETLSCKYELRPPTSLKGIGVIKCISDINLNNITYIASDEFTNETLISYILNYLTIFTYIPPLYVKHYKGSVCDNTGLNIMEYCDLGSLDSISTNIFFKNNISPYNIEFRGRKFVIPLLDHEIIFKIFQQLVCAIYMLQFHLDFTSGDLKAGNVFVKSEPIDTIYYGIPLQANFTCKIGDYGKSSCMLYKNNGGIRFYNTNATAKIYLTLHPFIPDIDDNNYYTIGKILDYQIFTRTRHMGIPYYHSFDYYTILISFLSNKYIFYMFFATEYLRNIFWDPVWDVADSEKCIKRIEKMILAGKGYSIRDTLDILKQFKLRCDALQIVFAKLQSFYK